MFTVDFKSLTTWRAVSQDDADYVIRRFNRSSARLEKSVGLNLRWSPPYAIFRSNWNPESTEMKVALLCTRLAQADSWLRVELDCG